MSTTPSGTAQRAFWRQSLSRHRDLLLLLAAVGGYFLWEYREWFKPRTDPSAVGIEWTHTKQILAAQLAGSDPAGAEQALICEHWRLRRLMSQDSAVQGMLRLRRWYRQAAGRERVQDVLLATEGRGYEVSGPICQQLNQRADSLYPIPGAPADAPERQAAP